MTNEMLYPAATQTTVAESIALAKRVAAGAADIVIDSPEMYGIAGTELVNVNKALAELEERRMRITRPMDEAKKEVMALFKPATDQLSGLKASISGAMLTWKRAEDARIAQERAEAERKHAEERERLEQEARDLAAKAEAATGKKAATLHQKAQEAADAAALAEVSAPLVAAPTAMASGTSTATRWVVGTIDLLTLVQAAAANPDAYLPYLVADAVKLGALATALKKDAKVPGVTFEAVESIRASRR